MLPSPQCTVPWNREPNQTLPPSIALLCVSAMKKATNTMTIQTPTVIVSQIRPLLLSPNSLTTVHDLICCCFIQ